MKIYYFIFACLICGCLGKQKDSQTDCHPNFWAIYAKSSHNIIKDSVLYIGNILKQDSIGVVQGRGCMYKGWLNLLKQRLPASDTSLMDALKINGYFFERFDRIYLSIQPQNEHWLLFDFNMEKGNARNIIHPLHNNLLYYENNEVNEYISYQLLCENIQYLDEYQDDIYTFRFKNFSVPSLYCGNKIDWVFYVGKNVGVIGSYLGSISRFKADTTYTNYYEKKIGNVLDSVIAKEDDMGCL